MIITGATSSDQSEPMNNGDDQMTESERSGQSPHSERKKTVNVISRQDYCQTHPKTFH